MVCPLIPVAWHRHTSSHLDNNHNPFQVHVLIIISFVLLLCVCVCIVFSLEFLEVYWGGYVLGGVKNHIKAFELHLLHN